MLGKIVPVLLLLFLCTGCTKYSPESESNETAPKDETSNMTPDTPEGPEAGQGVTFEATHVIASKSAYYTDGPQQMRPPDGTFSEGTRVELIRESGSYSLVKSESGVEAYVSSDVLKPVE